MSILVSISCITYNHEDYISDAVEGFLLQKTNFKYEILIHDDASTDKTADIIKRYEKKYPDIIKPIYQLENQYSKGVKVGQFNRNRALGKYIALCEGDDYWTDPFKLQKQIDYMEDNPGCSMCFHSVKVVDKIGNYVGRSIAPYDKNCIVPIKDILENGGGFFGTNSIVYPKKCMNNPPDFYLKCPVGDGPLALNLAIQGSVYYFNEEMSAYRKGVVGSWTQRTSISKEKIIKHSKKMIEMREAFNEYTNYKYSESIEVMQIKNEANILAAQGNLKLLRDDRYERLREELGWIKLIQLYLNKCYPKFFQFLVRLKRKTFILLNK